MSAKLRADSATSTRAAPLYVVPADDKENAQLIVSRIILVGFPEISQARDVESGRMSPPLRDGVRGPRASAQGIVDVLAITHGSPLVAAPFGLLCKLQPLAEP